MPVRAASASLASRPTKRPTLSNAVVSPGRVGVNWHARTRVIIADVGALLVDRGVVYGLVIRPPRGAQLLDLLGLQRDPSRIDLRILLCLLDQIH
jgi:hypothetical protein